jgi:hypothetical protein
MVLAMSSISITTGFLLSWHNPFLIARLEGSCVIVGTVFLPLTGLAIGWFIEAGGGVHQ